MFLRVLVPARLGRRGWRAIKRCLLHVLWRLLPYVVGGFSEFGLTVEPADTVVLSDRPLTLDCVARFTDDTGTHTASIQWLKDSQPFALSPPDKYDLLLMSFLRVFIVHQHNNADTRYWSRHYVRPSLTLHIVSKHIVVLSSAYDSAIMLVFPILNICAKFRRSHPRWGVEYRWGIYISWFSTYIWLYVWSNRR